MGKPKSFQRFLIMANACINHNAYDELELIKVPTFVIGGSCDKVVGGESSKEIAERIEGSKLLMYEGFGHGVYEETKDFNQKILEFLE